MQVYYIEELSQYGKATDHELEQITSLELTIEYLQVFPEIILKMKALKELTIRHSVFPTLPYEIQKLAALEKLDMYNNQLTALPKSIGALVALEELNLTGNRLTSLPESIGNLVNLKKLSLGNNQLMVIPESIGSLINLTSLTLNNNKLRELPESIGNLRNLRKLDLYSSGLKHIPESIFKLSLDLNNSQFSPRYIPFFKLKINVKDSSKKEIIQFIAANKITQKVLPQDILKQVYYSIIYKKLKFYQSKLSSDEFDFFIGEYGVRYNDDGEAYNFYQKIMEKYGK